MRLDINTLFLVTIYVEAMLGLLLLFAWVQNTRIAVSPDGPLDVSAMLAEADQALYQAKERGRNRIEVASLDLVLRLDASTPSLRINTLAREDAA